MAKTLVALYDTCTDAERVVHELMQDGFPRSDVHLALDHTEGCETQHAAVAWDSASEGDTLCDTLVDLGVPYEEAHAYAEGVRRGGALVVVESSDERADRGMAILQRLHPVNIHERSAQWQQEGWTGADVTAKPSAPRSRAATATRSAQEQGRATARVAPQGASPQRVQDDKEVTIPVVDEEITIGTQEVERGHVRIYSRVTEQPVEESIRLREEKVTVERRPVDRPATDADFAAAGKDVIEMTETVEEPVVTKRARVVEEVVVQKEVTEHTETVRGTARHTEVEVQREPGSATATRRVTPLRALRPMMTTSGSTMPRRLRHRGAAIRSMSPRTAMATSWARTSATGVATGLPSKRTPAATGKRGIRTPGSASKTPSAMAGTQSAHGPKRLDTAVVGPRGAPSWGSGAWAEGPPSVLLSHLVRGSGPRHPAGSMALGFTPMSEACPPLPCVCAA